MPFRNAFDACLKMLNYFFFSWFLLKNWFFRVCTENAQIFGVTKRRKKKKIIYELNVLNESTQLKRFICHK